MKRIALLLVGLLCIHASMVMAQADIEVINIENPVLRPYMADSTYFRPGGENRTVVAKYTGATKYKHDNEIPRGKVVTWQTNSLPEDIEQIVITVSQREDYRDSVTFSPRTTKATSYTIYNSLPGHTYYYKAEEWMKDGRVNHLADGAFRTEGRIRMINVAGAHNVRDIGGWPSTLGGTLRYGRLYRSGNLDKVTPQGIHDFVTNLGVTAELDLRGEAKRTSSPLGEDVAYTRIVAGSYLYALRDHADLIAADVMWIVERLREGRNVDWHCAIGCDRCGTLSMVVEGVLGVGEIDLGRDYEISRLAGHERFRNQAGFTNMLKWMKKQGPADDLAQCFYDYLLANGVPAADLDYLREVMIVR